MAKLNVDVITPQAKIHEGEADEVSVNTVNGEIGILPGHVAILTQIQPGELRIKNGTKTQSIAIFGGYVEVTNNQVNILGNYAVRAEDIELAKVEQAKDRAEKAMKEKVSMEDLANIQGELAKNLLQIKVARRHRSTRI